MTAIAISAPGGPEVLQPTTRPVPQPGPGEVLIRVAAAGVNRPDVLQRMGFYPPPPGASDLPGLEIAGVIAGIGPGGDPELLGQAVCALVAGGGYAEYCLAPIGSCLPVPKGFSMAEAAALPETVFTVWHNLFERGYVHDGETVLVHGGTSGIGTTAIGLCKLFDIKIIVTCGSADKCAAAMALGADLAVDYSAEDYVEAVKTFTGGKGVNVVLDMVGGDYLPRNLACLAEDGRHVSIAFQRGAKAEIDITDVMRRRLTLTGSTLRARSADFKALLADEIHRTLWPRLAEGGWKPAMDRAFPLADASAAHARMQAGEHVGKIVLSVG
ncbi:putative PIG3 family NAD(P)H quinone oxidoreductase [Sphingopyxis sp. OAS728]|uniref:NAD(P)H-quinone oxidoreductase n=1 Tax=Sphingopyxis sp. OAS728 TaxID=2663823 RepID=UPI001A021E0B|nr:NAD(P)H-quinone oxidoreductase [Sphingopyxis sp. OAS728]MBE1527668.1 putative PIG3 family NAD(P)H quinone oxidoreductase [Sphingopyxis sp. OAS728]